MHGHTRVDREYDIPILMDPGDTHEYVLLVLVPRVIIPMDTMAYLAYSLVCILAYRLERVPRACHAWQLVSSAHTHGYR